ncbi:hypothetical protein CNR22_18570 [Sphingobacteriaceae bacterium]|nr:hypothetical protein CNR22_18570 [Sphingobacteriaceae bacterium]
MKQDEQNLYEEYYQVALTLLQEGKHHEEIQEHLGKKSEDIVLITVVIKEARNAHYAGLRKQGLRLLLIGCITGLSGFLITCINFNTNRSIDLALYGLTTLGISLVFWGLFKIIG